MNQRALRTRAEGDARTDAALLAALADGDLGSLGSLYDRHARTVWSVLHRVTGPGGEDVEDLVHATFLKLPELAKAFDGRPSCRNWLCGIAVHIALRRGRSLRRFAQMLSRFAGSDPGLVSGDPETQAGQREQMLAIESALLALAPKKRAVFVLVELQGLDHHEVAEALAIPVATVRTRLFHAKHALREALTRADTR
jgi:RNA polymerase sigma-70 factor (ECF subfamily)